MNNNTTALTHVQPQAVDLERTVIGALLIDREAYALIYNILRPDSFYDPRHQKIYNAIEQLVSSNNPVDVYTVIEKLSKLGYLDDIGGAGYITEICNRVASSANIEYHARIVAQKAMLRKIIKASGSIYEKAFASDADPDSILQEAETSFFELSEFGIKKGYQQIDPILAESDKMLRDAANGTGLTGVTTGFPLLDEMTHGWQAGDLIILAGRPAMGKTALAISMIQKSAIEKNIPVGFFSLEMTGVQLVNRLVSNFCNLEGSRFLSGDVTPTEWFEYDSKRLRMKGKPLFIDDTPGLSLYVLKTEARRMVAKHGVKLIVIDYLQLMTSSGMKFGTRQEEVAFISKNIKGLAKELNIPIIALSQLNRGVENREGLEGKRPQLSDLRESGSIEQDADLVLFVHRPDYYHIFHDDQGRNLQGMAQLIIAKHRKGATGDVFLKFIPQYTKFLSIEDPQLNLFNKEDYSE